MTLGCVVCGAGIAGESFYARTERAYARAAADLDRWEAEVARRANVGAR